MTPFEQAAGAWSGSNADADADRPLAFLGPDGVFEPGGRPDDPVGQTQARALAPHLARLTAPTLRGFYRDMALTRAFDAEATALQRRGELGLWVSSLGQEAAQVGSARALAPQDYAFPSYREHAVVHARGVDFADILPMFRGVSHGGWDPVARRCHPYTLVVGAHALHAAGYAMGARQDGAVGTGEAGKDEAVIAYVGDGAMSQGDVNEAMIFAAAFDAPLVLVCQNNGWAISTPTARQSRVPFARRADGFGIPALRIDGNDVTAAHAATAAALDHARSGAGPAFIEAVTYRMGAHTTADDPSRYRERAEEEAWARKDPMARLAAWLKSASEEDDGGAAFFDAVAEEGQALAERVRAACLALAAPPLDDFFARAYSAPHPQVAEEAAAWAAYGADLEVLAPVPAGEVR